MSTPNTANREIIARDFRERMQGKLDDATIDAAMKSLMGATQKYRTTGNVTSFVFYLGWTLEVEGGKEFDGHSGGLSTPGSGSFNGFVFTDNLQRLYDRTETFEFNTVSGFANLLFFDGSTNLLGHFEGSALSTVVGVGGGKGDWS